MVWSSVPDAEVSVIVLFAVTVLVPVLVIFPHPPVNVIVYVKEPETVGVPLIVTTLEAHAPLTPVGNPVMVTPVAPFVE